MHDWQYDVVADVFVCDRCSSVTFDLASILDPQYADCH